MNFDRIAELEEREFTSKLFKNAVFKGGGGSSGGGTNTIQKADPWSGQQPFLTYGFDQAQDRFKSDQPQFFPGSTIAPFNPNELSYQQSALDYATSGRPQALQAGAENVVGVGSTEPVYWTGDQFIHE